MSKERIPVFLDHLRERATAGKIETLLSVHVELDPAGVPIPAVTVFSGDLDPECASRILEHMRGIGKELRTSHAAGGGGQYPPPPPPPDPKRIWNSHEGSLY